MKARHPTPTIQSTVILAVLAVVPWLGGAPAHAQEEPLALRLADAVGPPGGTAALVVRTYASRPVGQGQVCGRAPSVLSPGSGGPFARLIASQVFSTADDARARAELVDTGTEQSVVVSFRSLSRTINGVDGPLAVFFLELDDTLEPGQRFLLEIDLANTYLRDEHGDLIMLEPISGELLIRDPADGYSLEPDGDRIAPGEIAQLAVRTLEPLRLRSGQVALSYDPAVTIGPPVVTVHPAYGNVEYQFDDGIAGLVVIRFRSPDRSFNRVPGEIFQIEVPTDPEVPPGTVTPVEIVDDLTFFVDGAGDMVTLAIEGPALLEFE